MSALLLLLLLLSVATIASRPGPFAAALDRVASPLLILCGLALGPLGLAVVSTSLRGGLEQALAVGVTWLGILFGLRSSSDELPPGTALRAFAVVAASTAASVLLAMAAMATPALLGWRAPSSPALLAGAALVVGGALVGSPPVDRENRAELALRTTLIDLGELIATACAIAALAVLPSWTGLPTSFVALVVIGVGLLLALLQRLLGGSAGGDVATRTIALLGVVAVAAGLLHEAGLPSAVSGLVAGTVLGRTDLGRALTSSLMQTERPARIVVVFMVGTLMPLSTTALLVGALLALGQLAVQLVATSWAVGHRPSSQALATGLSSSSIALVIAASFALAGFPEGGLLVSSSAVAIVLTDVLAAGLLLRGRLRTTPTTVPQEAS
jgi:hypothetical protein